MDHRVIRDSLKNIVRDPADIETITNAVKNASVIVRHMWRLLHCIVVSDLDVKVDENLLLAVQYSLTGQSTQTILTLTKMNKIKEIVKKYAETLPESCFHIPGDEGDLVEKYIDKVGEKEKEIVNCPSSVEKQKLQELLENIITCITEDRKAPSAFFVLGDVRFHSVDWNQIIVTDDSNKNKNNSNNNNSNNQNQTGSYPAKKSKKELELLNAKEKTENTAKMKAQYTKAIAYMDPANNNTNVNKSLYLKTLTEFIKKKLDHERKINEFEKKEKEEKKEIRKKFQDYLKIVMSTEGKVANNSVLPDKIKQAVLSLNWQDMATLEKHCRDFIKEIKVADTRYMTDILIYARDKMLENVYVNIGKYILYRYIYNAYLFQNITY